METSKQNLYNDDHVQAYGAKEPFINFQFLYW